MARELSREDHEFVKYWVHFDETRTHQVTHRHRLFYDSVEVDKLIAALREQLQAITRDYEAAQHLADATGKEWQLCKQRVLELEQEQDILIEQEKLQANSVTALQQQLAEREQRILELEARIKAMERSQSLQNDWPT